MSTNSQVAYTAALLHLLLSRCAESCDNAADMASGSPWHRGAADGYRNSAKLLAQYFSGSGFRAPDPLQDDALRVALGKQQFLAPSAEQFALYHQPDLRLPVATGLGNGERAQAVVDDDKPGGAGLTDDGAAAHASSVAGAPL